MRGKDMFPTCPLDSFQNPTRVEQSNLSLLVTCNVDLVKKRAVITFFKWVRNVFSEEDYVEFRERPRFLKKNRKENPKDEK